MVHDQRKIRRVTFERGFDVWIMGIDGTWKLECLMKDASTEGARLIVEDARRIQSKEFFLLLSSTGLAYRRCQLAWVNGEQVGVRFLGVSERRESLLAAGQR